MTEIALRHDWEAWRGHVHHTRPCHNCRAILSDKCIEKDAGHNSFLLLKIFAQLLKFWKVGLWILSNHRNQSGWIFLHGCLQLFNGKDEIADAPFLKGKFMAIFGEHASLKGCA